MRVSLCHLLIFLDFYIVFSKNDPVCNHKVDCGWSGISMNQCHQLGCCWDTSVKNIWCSAPNCSSSSSCSNHGKCINSICQCDKGWEGWNCSQSSIQIVHVIQSCHLDVGFADSAAGIINRYFDKHFPKAIQVANELRKDTSTTVRLQFMAQSYVVSLYLDCPPNMGIHCPTPEQQATFKAALRNQDITYHAFPFNSELELYDPLLIEEGIRMTHELDSQFGLAPKQILSQRDVPGITRSIIPILRKIGVNAISVGVNGASTPPSVPKIFLWVDPNSKKDIFAMWHPGGYGGFSKNEVITVPGLEHALAFDWNGDNAGPRDANAYKKNFASIQKEFPNAKVIASTFDNFTQHLPAVKDQLPVITSEFGDTWLYGVPSDPQKAQKIRIVNRVWANFIQSGGDTNDPVYKNATRLVLKGGEHTWGRDVKSNLKDNSAWSNIEFEKARVGPNRDQYERLEESWWEQRQWGFDIPLETLKVKNHSLAAEIEKELLQSHAKEPKPNVEGYVKINNITQIFTIGNTEIGFDKTGAITHLVLDASKVEWCSPKNPLGSLLYRTYSAQEYVDFLKTYLTKQPPPSWAYHDFGKPNCTTECIASNSKAILQSLWQKSGQSSASFLLQLVIEGDAHTITGAPAIFWMQVDIPGADKTSSVDITLSAFNKTSTRLPEAMFFTFHPKAIEGQSGNWRMDKLGEWIEMNNTVKGGSQHLHGVMSGFQYQQSPSATLTINTIDTPIICLGQPNAFPTPTNSTPDITHYGVSAVLWDNLWGTNYVMWYPFKRQSESIPGEGDIKFRFSLQQSKSLK